MEVSTLKKSKLKFLVKCQTNEQINVEAEFDGTLEVMVKQADRIKGQSVRQRSELSTNVTILQEFKITLSITAY